MPWLWIDDFTVANRNRWQNHTCHTLDFISVTLWCGCSAVPAPSLFTVRCQFQMSERHKWKGERFNANDNITINVRNHLITIRLKCLCAQRVVRLCNFTRKKVSIISIEMVSVNVHSGLYATRFFFFLYFISFYFPSKKKCSKQKKWMQTINFYMKTMSLICLQLHLWDEYSDIALSWFLENQADRFNRFSHDRSVRLHCVV